MSLTRLLTVGLTAGAVLAPSALAAAAPVHGHATVAHKKKKPKKRHKAAARGPKGDRGAAGAAGSPGAAGASGSAGATGATGPSGTSIVAKLRFAGSMGTGDGDSGAAIALSPPTWLQGTGETDRVLGQVTFLAPAKCDPQPATTDMGLPDPTGDPYPGNGYVEVQVDDRSSMYASSDSYDATQAGRSQTVDLSSFGGSPDLFEPDAPVTHRVKVTAYDSCNTTGQEYKVTAVKVDVLGIR